MKTEEYNVGYSDWYKDSPENGLSIRLAKDKIR